MAPKFENMEAGDPKFAFLVVDDGLLYPYHRNFEFRLSRLTTVYLPGLRVVFKHLMLRRARVFNLKTGGMCQLVIDIGDAILPAGRGCYAHAAA